MGDAGPGRLLRTQTSDRTPCLEALRGLQVTGGLPTFRQTDAAGSLQRFFPELPARPRVNAGEGCVFVLKVFDIGRREEMLRLKITSAMATAWLAVMVLALPVLLGCGKGGPKLVKVSGQVLIDGKPLAAGVPGFIQVIPEGTRPATGTIDPQTGKFTLTTFEKEDGCPVGTHRVTVTVRAMVGTESVSLIPERYADPRDSGLTVTIDQPTDSLTIELTGPMANVPAARIVPESNDPNIF